MLCYGEWTWGVFVFGLIHQQPPRQIVPRLTISSLYSFFPPRLCLFCVLCVGDDEAGDGLTRQELCDACVSLLLRRDDKNLGSVMPALTLTSTDPRPNPGQLDVGKSRWLPPCLSPSPPDSKPPTHLFKACNGDDVRVSGGREREDGEAGAARGEGLLGGTDGVPCSRRSGVLAEVEEIENRRCSDASLAGEGANCRSPE